MTEIEFFMPMVPPSVTHQTQAITVAKGKPRVYDTPELKEAREKLTAHLAKHRPAQKLTGAIKLTTVWVWPAANGHAAGDWKLTKPDTDNMVKLLKDCMTRLGFWKDDSQVANELTEKLYGLKPGILVRVEQLPRTM